MISGQLVRVGVIGVGRWGLEHLSAYQGLPNVEVLAVADNSAGQAENVARRLGIPRWFTEYEDLCSLEELDAVSIVTPESDHLGPVLAACGHRKHMLVEKPIATDIAQGHRMTQAARDAGVIFMPGHLLRFETRYALIKEKLVSGELGRVVSIQARRNRTVQTRRDYARAHPVFAAAIHDIDLLLWYAACPVKLVRGFHRNIAGNATPDVMWGILEFENDVLGMVECTWLTPDASGIVSDDRLHLITDRGTASLDLVQGGLSLWRESGFELPDVSYAPRIRGHVEGALKAELSYFVSCVARSEAPSVITPDEALLSIRVASALVKSADKKQDVSV